MLALPLAAIYPTIERHWLRQPFGDDVIEEHEAVSSEASDERPAKAGHYGHPARAGQGDTKKDGHYTPKKRSA